MKECRFINFTIYSENCSSFYSPSCPFLFPPWTSLFYLFLSIPLCGKTADPLSSEIWVRFMNLNIVISATHDNVQKYSIWCHIPLYLSYSLSRGTYPILNLLKWTEAWDFQTLFILLHELTALWVMVLVLPNKIFPIFAAISRRYSRISMHVRWTIPVYGKETHTKIKNKGPIKFSYKVYS